MSETNISVDEWLDALGEASHGPTQEGLTSAELMKLLNINQKRVQQFLREGVLSGKLIIGHRHIEHDWDGRARTYQVYRIVK